MTAARTPLPGSAAGLDRARWWGRSYWLLLQWEVANLRLLLPVLLILQIALYGGAIVGLGFYFDEVSERQAQFLATGGSVLALATLGLTFVPSIIAQRKVEGAHDYLWALPVPRLAMLVASLTVFVVVAIPGASVALLLATLRYHIDLAVSPLLLPAAILVLITTTSIGAAIGHLAPQPAITSAIGNLLFVVLFLFSPVNFPAERLPDWLQAAHAWLPFEHMANAMRAGLTDLGDDVERSLAILSSWAIVAWVLLARVLGRRP